MPTAMVLDGNTEHSDLLVVLPSHRNSPIACHRGVVGYYSDVIGAAMRTDMTETESGVFTVTDEKASVEGVCHFLLAMYNPWDPATMDEHVHEIYRLSHVYIAPKVMSMAVEAFGRLLTVANFWAIASANEGNECAELIAQCKNFLDKQCKADVDGLLSETNDGFKYANGKCPTMVSALAMSTLRRYQAAMPIPCGKNDYACEKHPELEAYSTFCEKCREDAKVQLDATTGMTNPDSYEKREHVCKKF